jgi:hypothetical protein
MVRSYGLGLLAFLLMLEMVAAHACEDGHWVEEVLVDGKILKLEDGSLWRVEPIDTVTSSIWLPVSDVIVCDDKIVNVDDGETVHARQMR